MRWSHQQAATTWFRVWVLPSLLSHARALHNKPAQSLGLESQPSKPGRYSLPVHPAATQAAPLCVRDVAVLAPAQAHATRSSRAQTGGAKRHLIRRLWEAVTIEGEAHGWLVFAKIGLECAVWVLETGGTAVVRKDMGRRVGRRGEARERTRKKQTCDSKNGHSIATRQFAPPD
jgi:hypothetical protein